MAQPGPELEAAPLAPVELETPQPVQQMAPPMQQMAPPMQQMGPQMQQMAPQMEQMAPPMEQISQSQTPAMAGLQEFLIQELQKHMETLSMMQMDDLMNNPPRSAEEHE